MLNAEHNLKVVYGKHTIIYVAYGLIESNEYEIHHILISIRNSTKVCGMDEQCRIHIE